MSNDTVRLISLSLAGVTLPVGYIAVCLWLVRQRTWWFTFVSYFVLFGTLGGWAFAIAMSPSGIAAASAVFLFTLALAACVGSSVVLTFRRKKTRPEWIALVCGYSYPVCLLAMFGVGYFLEKSS